MGRVGCVCNSIPLKSRDYLYDIVNMRDEEEGEEEESLEQLSQWITEN